MRPSLLTLPFAPARPPKWRPLRPLIHPPLLCCADLKAEESGTNRFTVLPCLLNEQSRLRFCVPERYAPTARRGPYGRSVNISVIGGQPTITLTGPDIPVDEALSQLGRDSPQHSLQHRVPEPSLDHKARGASPEGSHRPARQATEMSLLDTPLGAERLSTTDESITFLLPSQGQNAVQSIAEGPTPAPSAALTLAAASIPETAHEGPTMSDFDHILTPHPGDVSGAARTAQPGGTDAAHGVHADGAAAGSPSRDGEPALVPPACRTVGNAMPWGQGEAAHRIATQAQPGAVFAASIPASSHSSMSNGGGPPVPPLAAPMSPASPLRPGPATPASEQSTGLEGGDMAPLLQGTHAARPSEISGTESLEAKRGAAPAGAAQPVAAPHPLKTPSLRSGATAPGQGGAATVGPTPADLGNSPFNCEVHEPQGSCFGRGCNGSVFNRRTRVRRQYDMAVEVNSASAQSCFRFTKVVHVRDKYIVENRTGEILEVRLHPPLRLLPARTQPPSRCGFDCGIL